MRATSPDPHLKQATRTSGAQLFLGPEGRPTMGRWKHISEETPFADLQQAKTSVREETGAETVAVHDFEEVGRFLESLFGSPTAEQIAGYLQVCREKTGGVGKAFVKALAQTEPDLNPRRWTNCLESAHDGKQPSMKDWAREEAERGHFGPALSSIKQEYVDYGAVASDLREDPHLLFIEGEEAVHKFHVIEIR